MSLLRAICLAVLLLGPAACGRSETRQSANHVQDSQPTLGEQRSVERDPLHIAYLKLLYAAFNLDSCERGAVNRVVIVTKSREESEQAAKAKGLGPSLELTQRVFRSKLSAELHIKCHPNFQTALTDMERAARNFREQVARRS